MDEELIEAVRMFPCIYDNSLKQYRNKLFKKKSWALVANATGASVDQCQTRWKSLRDRYVREVSANPKSDAAEEEKVKWRYLDALSFLQKHLVSRRTFSNVQWTSEQKKSAELILLKKKEEKLIETVQKFPLLYDKSLKEYNNKSLKKQTWTSVANATGATVNQCQTRWKSLRDRYVREISTIPKSGTTADENAKWRYLDALSFLQSHVAPQRTISNIQLTQSKPHQSTQPTEATRFITFKIMEEKLIDAIQMFPCLYNKSLKEYRNKLFKKKAWASVANATGATVNQCQIRWKSLRDRYVREISSMPKFDTTGEEIVRWRYLDSLSFLQNHVVQQRTFPTIQSSDQQGSTDSAEITEFNMLEEPQTSTESTESFEFHNIQEPNIWSDDTSTHDSSTASHPLHPKSENCSTTSPPCLFECNSDELIESAHQPNQLDDLCSTMIDMITEKIGKTEKSRNADFLKVLDSYLLKHSEEEQDELKIRILNLVHAAKKV